MTRERRPPWENALGERGLRVLLRTLWRALELTHSRLLLDPALGRDQQNKIWWLVRFDDVVNLRDHFGEPRQAWLLLAEIERDVAHFAQLAQAPRWRRLVHGPVRSGWLRPYLAQLEARLELEREAFATIEPSLLAPDPIPFVGGRRSRRSPLAERAVV